jgi:hypothetical protein
MTAGRDLHDIHTILYLVSAWDNLTESAKAHAIHRMQLLYIAITKGWPAALYYDQQGTDEFLNLARLLGSVPAGASWRPQRAQQSPTHWGQGKRIM